MTAAVVPRQLSDDAVTCSRSSTFKLTGNMNQSRQRLFSTFDYLPEPQEVEDSSAAAHSRHAVSPFTIAPLPSSLTAAADTADGSPAGKQQLYYHPLTAIPSSSSAASHSGLTSLRARSLPSHLPVTAHPKTVSMAYERDDRWLFEPALAPMYSSLYRSVRSPSASALSPPRHWRGAGKPSGYFPRDAAAQRDRGEEKEEEEAQLARQQQQQAQQRQAAAASRVQHRDGWRGGGSGLRSVSEKEQLRGGVAGYFLSPYERTERARAGLLADSMRDGYRGNSARKQGQPPMRLAGDGATRTLTGRRYHSATSADHRCRHDCNGSETLSSS